MTVGPLVPAIFEQPIVPRPLAHEWATAWFSPDQLGLDHEASGAGQQFSAKLYVAGFNRFAMYWEFTDDHDITVSISHVDPVTLAVLPTPFAVILATFSPVTESGIQPWGRKAPVTNNADVWVVKHFNLEVNDSLTGTTITVGILCGVL